MSMWMGVGWERFMSPQGTKPLPCLAGSLWCGGVVAVGPLLL